MILKLIWLALSKDGHGLEFSLLDYVELTRPVEWSIAHEAHGPSKNKSDRPNRVHCRPLYVWEFQLF